MKPTITTNEYISCLELVELHPGNTYWEDRCDLARVNFDEAAGVDVEAFLLVMAAYDVQPETAHEAHAAMMGDWAADPLSFIEAEQEAEMKENPYQDEYDPRTPEEKALDEWQADAKETEFGTAEWFKGVQPIEF